MIYHLSFFQIVVVNIFGFEGPLKVEAGGGVVLVLDPASLLERLLQEAIATIDDEDFCRIFYLMLFLPSFHISNVQKYLKFGHVSFHKGL